MKNRIDDLIQEVGPKNGVSEIIINSNDNVFVEKDGEMIRIDTRFSDEEIEKFCGKIAQFNNKEFDSDHPILDGNLPDGSRINFIHKDYTGSTHAITIRIYSRKIEDFSTSGNIFGLSDDWIRFFKTMVQARTNIIVSGGTGVGKTTLLNLLLQEISFRERVVTIEDTRELQFKLPNVVRLEAKPANRNYAGLSIRDLMKNTLRMRPDRIIVGEVRGGEVFDLLQAMNTGHEGSMTTVHANSPSECLLRLENLYLLSGYDLPLKALRFQISTATDFIVQIRRDKKGNRVVHQVTEVAGMEGEKILLQDIGHFKDDELKFTGFVPACISKFHKVGLPKDFFAGT